MPDDERRPNDLGENLREGVRTVAGIFGALKDAIEESFEDLRERGDLSPEKAREAARSTMERAQAEMEGMRDRLDFATRRELETLRTEVVALRARVERLEGGGSSASESGANPDFPVDGG